MAWSRRHEGEIRTPAPTLNPSASPTLGTVAEGSFDPAGVGIAALAVDRSISDPDGAAVEAIAASGGSTAYSSASDVATIAVTAVNGAPTFAPRNSDGRVTVALSDSYHEGRAALVKPDGRIVIAGFADTGLGVGGVSDNAFAVMRLNADGSLDRRFNGSGKLVVNLGTGSAYDDGYGVAVQSDGSTQRSPV